MPVYFGDRDMIDAPIIVAYRHAHRHFEDPTENGGLSDLGKEQALDAAKEIRELFYSYTRKLRALEDNEGAQRRLRLWSSPKRRCQETIAFLHTKASKKRLPVSPVVVREELDEQEPMESPALFEKRINDFLESLEQVEGMTVLCSHGDWLPKLHNLIAGESLNAAHAQAHVYIWDKSHLEWKYCGYLD